MSTLALKQTILRHLRARVEGAPLLTTAQLSTQLKVLPRPLRAVLKDLHEHNLITYDKQAHGWRPV